MINVPDRTPFQIRHAAPVAGPGIERGDQPAWPVPGEGDPAARRQPADTTATIGAMPASGRPLRRRQHHTLVDLETVMTMLDMARGGERKHLKTIIGIFDSLNSASRTRMLTVLNQMFK